MNNYHELIYSTLNAILPTHYELLLTSGAAVPCLSYMEISNANYAMGDTVGYGTIQYQIKVWANRIADIQTYAIQVDDALRELGLRRVGSTELFDKESTMIQKVMTYEVLALEKYNNAEVNPEAQK